MKLGKQFRQMFMAQLKMTFREKQAWFWGIFFPVILMVIFMLIFSGDSNEEFEAKVAIVNENPNETSQMLFEQIQNLSMLEIETGEPVSREQAESWLKEEDVNAVIVLPETLDEKSILLMVNRENERNVTTQAVSSLLNNFIQSANLMALGGTPTYELQFESISSGSSNLQQEDFILTGMIALSIAQGGLFGMVDLVDMRRKGLMKRLRMTPAKMGLFGLSDMTMRMVFACVQIILLSLIGVLGFGANLHIDFLSLLVVFLIGALSFNAIGYLFSSFSKTMESYMGLANITSFLMMFLSGIFFPVETMPDWLQPVSQVLPLTYFVDGLRDSMVYETGITTSSFWIGIGIVVIWGLISFFIGSFVYKSKAIAETR
ncbi:MAG TPA: ABC transporter permease [Bacillus sp. (in: firmicutes)]|nr:ABC transporter permease [Bacillus sp. (in: firmicutes)]